MTPRQAAEWMLEQFELKRFLYQEEAASHFLFMGEGSLVSFDASSSLCIDKKVLAEFKKLTPFAVYERGEKFWRDRLPSDLPGRQQ